MELILFILGPSGAGKTTLGDELAREALAPHQFRPAPVVRGINAGVRGRLFPQRSQPSHDVPKEAAEDRTRHVLRVLFVQQH